MEGVSTPLDAPSTRQKNCKNCIQGKRRCDRRTPVCTRCAERKIPCIYAKSRTTTASKLEQRVVVPSSCTEEQVMKSAVYSLLGPALPLDLGYFASLPVDSRLGVSPARHSPQPTVDVDITMDPLTNFVDINGSASLNQWLVQLGDDHFTEISGSSADDEIAKAFEEMAAFCANVEPSHVHDPSSTLHHLTTRVKGFVTDMATRSCTPFMHRFLYRDHAPRCIVSVFGACALYVHRSPGNVAMVMRALQAGVLDASSSAGCVATPVEKLARTQALFLYQIIRLFDGDVALQAAAERDLPLLKTWLSELCRLRDTNIAESHMQLEKSVSEMTQPLVEWERWIFAESMRRTIVIAYSVLGLYELMKDPDGTDPTPWASAHVWTLSRSLWEASSAFDFRRAWTSAPRFSITSYSFGNFLENGRGDEMDDFAEILMGAYMGVDATKEFMSSRTAQQAMAST